MSIHSGGRPAQPRGHCGGASIVCQLTQTNHAGPDSTASIEVLPELHTLDLSDNRFCEFPAQLPQGIAILDLSANCIAAAPSWLASRCMKLEALFLHSNGVHGLDDSVLQLPHLQQLSLHDNPICDGLSQPSLPVSYSARAIKQVLARSINRPANTGHCSSPGPEV